MKFGITLSNRGILPGLTSMPKLLALAHAAEACSSVDSIWAGDALFVNQRLDALTLLAAIAGRTSWVRSGPSCRPNARRGSGGSRAPGVRSLRSGWQRWATR
jgi:alkanesulfonate monooxygenase SsuD/methylene tetrahydromethanopterin reductase-like flavin-dependent oxidoreductase (luciferase family)